MLVRRVPDATGSSIEPPIDPEWSDLTKLRWMAAVAVIDSGGILEIQVEDATGWSRSKPAWSEVWITHTDVYSIRVGGRGLSPMSFSSAWTFLNGVSIGAEATHDHYEEKS